MKNQRFGAFIMTYERPLELINTLDKIYDQTKPPEVILVVDNSISHETTNLKLEYRYPNLEYVRMGYNSGPAGASKFGLKKLVDLGMDWIYWGDDNNPPRDSFVFENMFVGISELCRRGVKLGVFGGKGGNFNKINGKISPPENKILRENKYLEVDTVPGGYTMLVNSHVVKDGILPDEKLFFGFEEFDFCIRIKNASYRIYVDAEKWLQIRHKHNNCDDNYRWRNKSFGKAELISREFYSTRNLFFIYYRNNNYLPLLYLLLKSLLKMIFGFRFGLSYGKKMFIAQYDAIFSFLFFKYYKHEKYVLKN